MSRGIKRDGNGQFAPGQSGNPQGARLRQPRKLLTPADIDRCILEVAAEAGGTIQGRELSRLEVAIRSLLKGEAGNRLTAKDFIELTKSAAYSVEARERRDAQRLKDEERRTRGW